MGTPAIKQPVGLSFQSGHALDMSICIYTCIHKLLCHVMIVVCVYICIYSSKKMQARTRSKKRVAAMTTVTHHHRNPSPWKSLCSSTTWPINRMTHMMKAARMICIRQRWVASWVLLEQVEPGSVPTVSTIWGYDSFMCMYIYIYLHVCVSNFVYT